MKAIDCSREPELLELLASGQWPVRGDVDLVDHVQRCPTCADIVTVVAALVDDRDSPDTRGQLPGSGVAWWRAQMRARAEDARIAAAPITAAQAAGVASGAAIALLLLGLGMGWLQSWGVRLAALASAGVPVPLSPLVLAIALCLWLLLAPIAVYLIVVDE